MNVQTKYSFHMYVNKQLQYSLKESTREKTGKGVQSKMSGQTKLTGNWIDFLPDPSNKKELFTFLMSKDYESNATLEKKQQCL